jgi:hypothetical protein
MKGRHWGESPYAAFIKRSAKSARRRAARRRARKIAQAITDRPESIGYGVLILGACLGVFAAIVGV